MSDQMKIVIRPAELDDKAFIYSSWLRGMRFGNSLPFYMVPSPLERIPSDLYYKEYEKIIDQTLCIPGVRVDIACEVENKVWTAGYAVYNTPNIYWVFVKPAFRKLGIANLLLKDKNIEVAKSTTKVGYAISLKKGIIYNPF